METANIVPLPVQITQKLLSSIKTQKTGKNDDEKSFNRYVRQLVDQYLDKEVVISKQPEDKVELIVQACRERFPEYAHWTTTRIRIYIESCRRLKKIKNSPILLAKRKAAGRKFREGQKLKKMITSQLSMQAAEYILKSNGVAVKDEPVSMLESVNKCDQLAEMGNNTARGVYTDQAPSPIPTSTPSPSMDIKNIMHLAPQLLSSTSPPTAITQLLATSPLIQSNPATTLCSNSGGSSKPQVSIPAFCMSPFTTTTTTTATVASLPTTRHSAFSSPLLSTSNTQNGTKSSSPGRNGCVSPLRPRIELPSTLSPVLSDNNVTSTSLQSKLNTMAVRESSKIKSFQIDNLINSQVEETVSSILENNLTSDDGDLDMEEKNMSHNEILNTKTLVTSYREAANFLYRAATELEQMLPPEHQVF